MGDLDLQLLMAATGDYLGGIDGDFGPKSTRAMLAIEARHRDAYTFDPTTTTDHRRKAACGQACLNQLSYEAGPIDGWVGVNTREALAAFHYQRIHRRVEIVDRTPGKEYSASDLPGQREVAAFYGRPDQEVPNRLTTIELPFNLRLDWNLRVRTNKMRVHEKCAPSLLEAMIAVRAEYPGDQMRDLGLDRYAGGYNKRRMRGGRNWSMHAYGCAVDFYAQPNGLRMKCPQALFCGPEYKPFLDIMEAHNWLPAIRLWGSDAMHFQQARL